MSGRAWVVQSSVHDLWWLRDRDAEWDARLAHVAAARRFLLCSTYFVDGDPYGLAFLQALRRAALGGVQVVLMVDAFGQRLAHRQQTTVQRAQLQQCLTALQQAGGAVVWCRPVRRMQRWLGYGNHIKVQVSDRADALYGSSNITARSFRGWGELSIRVTGAFRDVLCWDARRSLALAEGRLQDWQRAWEAQHPDGLASGSANGSANDHTPALTYHRDDPLAALPSHPAQRLRRDNTLTSQLVQLIEGAQQSLRIVSFYYKPAPRLQQAILRAAARGVQVEVFHSHWQALQETQLPWLATLPALMALANFSNVAIYQHLTGEHAKLVVVDDTQVALGSYNFEWAADDRLSESMLFGQGEPWVAPAASLLAALRADPSCQPFTKRGAHAPSRLQQTSALLSRPIRRWL